jgi:hypothetical protein
MYTSQYQPEFFKPLKPENQARHGCCGGKAPAREETKRVVQRACYIRYDGCHNVPRVGG